MPRVTPRGPGAPVKPAGKVRRREGGPRACRGEPRRPGGPWRCGGRRGLEARDRSPVGAGLRSAAGIQGMPRRLPGAGGSLDAGPGRSARPGNASGVMPRATAVPGSPRRVPDPARGHLTARWRASWRQTLPACPPGDAPATSFVFRQFCRNFLRFFTSNSRRPGVLWRDSERLFGFPDVSMSHGLRPAAPSSAAGRSRRAQSSSRPRRAPTRLRMDARRPPGLSSCPRP